MEPNTARGVGTCIFILLILLFFTIYPRNSKEPVAQAQISHPLPRSLNFSQCKWPPDSLVAIGSKGIYSVDVCIQLNADAVYNDKPKRYPINDLFKVPRTRETISFEEMSTLPKRLLDRIKYPKIYDTYPQDVPIKTIIGQIKAGVPVSYKPKYNYPIKILRTSTSVCSEGHKHDLVIVVKSGIYNFEAREEFRTFMKKQITLCPSFRVGYVFSIGLPRSKGGRTFNRDGNIVNLLGPAGDLLEKYDGKSSILMDKVYKECAKYNDIVLANYEDTYFNLSWKTVTNLRWISAFCDKNQGNFFMIIDDDHRMNLKLVEKFARETPISDLRTSIYGKTGWINRVYRSPSSKYFISHREMPWNVAAQYPRGMAQFIGADIVDDMAIATAYTKHNYLNEDVYLGLLAHKLGITIRNIFTMFDHYEAKYYGLFFTPMVAWKPYF